MEEIKNIYSKLSNIQQELKAPKGQRNDFGKYNYRSCEDILEAVKPICAKNKTTLVLSDELVVLGDSTPIEYKETYYDKDLKRENVRTIVTGNQRYYIKATATIYDIESGEEISNTAYAREEENKKGMDGSQITGTASSYARKYALNGLFNIDDTKDADTNEYHKQTNKPNVSVKNKQVMITDQQKEKIKELYTPEEIKEYLQDVVEKKKLSDLTLTEASDFIKDKLEGVDR